jgi:hypothetical protein
MNGQEFARVVVAVVSRWPHPDLTENHEALVALQEDVGHLDVEVVLAAIRRLVTEGERFQPRGPAILGTVARLQEEDRRELREREWQERQATRALESGDEVPREERVRAMRDAGGVLLQRVLSRMEVEG